MDDELTICFSLGPLHIKITHKNTITPTLHDGRINSKPNKYQARTSGYTTATAATIASTVSRRISHHLRSLSGSPSFASLARSMATTTMPGVPQKAPWRDQFQEHISTMDSPEFVLSTLHPAEAGKSSVPYVPRARYCIMRGFWAELPENKHNTAERNERVYGSDLPTFTTDVRMQKTFEVFSSSAGKADREDLVQGSGGGGPCEAVWWAKDVMVQWRIKGEAFVIGNDIEGEGEQSKESSGVRTVKSELGKRMRVVKEEGREGWSWKREMRGHFGNLSPGMRGSFRAPPPGRPVDQPYDSKNLKQGDKVEDLDDSFARENFRVVVIRPEEVESIDLSDPTKSRRHVYKFDAASGTWSHQECWP